MSQDELAAAQAKVIAQQWQLNEWQRLAEWAESTTPNCTFAEGRLCIETKFGDFSVVFTPSLSIWNLNVMMGQELIPLIVDHTTVHTSLRLDLLPNSIFTVGKESVELSARTADTESEQNFCVRSYFDRFERPDMACLELFIYPGTPFELKWHANATTVFTTHYKFRYPGFRKSATDEALKRAAAEWGIA